MIFRSIFVVYMIHTYLTRVLTRTEKMVRHFQVRKMSGNFEQTGKVKENHTKYWKLRKMLVIFSDIINCIIC